MKSELFHFSLALAERQAKQRLPYSHLMPQFNPFNPYKQFPKYQSPKKIPWIDKNPHGSNYKMHPELSRSGAGVLLATNPWISIGIAAAAVITFTMFNDPSQIGPGGFGDMFYYTDFIGPMPNPIHILS